MRVLRVVCGLMVGLLVSTASGPAVAQASPDPGMRAWQGAGCDACHGAFAQGGGGGDQPAGPSLRQTNLDRSALTETIRCGRPATPMPYFMSGAYAQSPCYGMAATAPPPDVTPGGAMSAADIDQIVEYLMARIVGKGAITREECGLYYANPNHPRCAGYR